MNFYAFSYSKEFHLSPFTITADVTFHIPAGIGVVLHSVFEMFLFFRDLFPIGFLLELN